ncbi:hypothetical protein [Tumebacillus amylolyticus]
MLHHAPTNKPNEFYIHWVRWNKFIGSKSYLLACHNYEL